MGAKRWMWAKGLLAVAVVAIMVLSALQAGVFSTRSTSSASAATSSTDLASTSSATTAQGTSTAIKVSPAAGPHPGTIEAYEPVPGGATTEDPAVAYDTTSYEVILNVYQTLVSYNGSSTATFVPTLATCVPGQNATATTGCASDYGTGFTGIFNQTGANFTGSNGGPAYWTYVIDPAAHFYDPATKTSWKVYPSDVMFSIARTIGWSDDSLKTPGWILAQSLLPNGSSKWDSGIHSPYNSTPENILGSMLINDSSYCPAKALNGVLGDGCITFVANGSGALWPEFNEFVEDNLGASVVPCGWFTYQAAGLPGWTGTSAANGDGSCALPDGGNTTQNAAWTTYISGLNPKSWDALESSVTPDWPVEEANVQWSMVGSGPYYASVNPGLSYSLAVNPAYVQPSGCSGVGGLAKYSGYCDPAVGAYIPSVDVVWETAEEGDSLGTDSILAGTADFAGIYTTETSTLLGFVHSGIWQYVLFPTLSTAFTPINLGIDYSAYNTTFGGTPLEANPINPTLLTDIGLRNFYVDAYPYTTIENTINTVDGIQFAFNAGGPIPSGMGNYYPSNVSWPYLLGNPSNSTAATPGTASWWWANITNPASPYYNATLVNDCTVGSPCTWPIAYFDGAPADLTLINDWAAEIFQLSGHTLEPYPLAETFTQFLGDLVGAYASPLASSVGFGWAPDYPDPTDYFAPMAQPNGDYTAPDTFNAQLALPQYEDNATCGHSNTTFANLTYWAAQAENPAAGTLNSTCQGVAYNVASYWMAIVGALPSGPTRVLDYNYLEQITNALAMYIYNGQSNELIGFAPWINPASINENSVIGGGGDSVWFQVQYAAATYSATITESGLTAGTGWSATVGPTTLSSHTASIVFPGLANATYDYSVSFEAGYSVAPSNGTITIAGANVPQAVAYTAFVTSTATVTFLETGLASNTSWTLVVSGYGAQTTNGPSLAFALPESHVYDYQAQIIEGYFAPNGSSVSLAALPLSETIAYTSIIGPVYALTFSEAGLPAGTSWAVTIGPASSGYTVAVTSVNNTFYETNGTYRATFTAPAGYTGPAHSIQVVVNGQAVTVAVVVFSTSSSAPPPPAASPSSTYLGTLAYALIGLLALLAIVFLVLAVHYAGRRPPASPPPQGWNEAPSDEAKADDAKADGETSPPSPPST
ncbi:MAG: hypothetical protein ACLQD9_04250 [Thermoplasmata archaeon]